MKVLAKIPSRMVQPADGSFVTENTSYPCRPGHAERIKAFAREMACNQLR